jgi:ubiquinone/menaquinone biosynthesis C-methylase UbiE
MSTPAAFAGSVPRNYHTYLVPLIFDAYAKDIAKRVPVRDGARILELACGTGVVTAELLRSMPASARLAATDLNQAMLDVARPILGGDPRLTLSVADACQIPFPDASFDAIVCQYGVMFFPDKVQAMREARRVLTPGGRYVFNVWDSLEHNPISRTVHETLRGMFPADPPLFLAKLPFGWSDHAEIQRTVRAGGFTSCAIETLAFPCEAPTAQHAAIAWLESTPLFPALQERGITDMTKTRDAMTQVLAAAYGDRPCRTTMQAIVVTAS